MQHWRALFGLMVFVLATIMAPLSVAAPMSMAPAEPAEMVDCHEAEAPAIPPSHSDSDCQNQCHCPVSQTVWLMRFDASDALAVVYDCVGTKRPVADARRDFDLSDRLKRPPRA